MTIVALGHICKIAIAGFEREIYYQIGMANFAPPKFTITNEILTNIGSIEAAREVIQNSPLVPTYERQFKKEAIARTVHYATSLEGNALNLTEVRRIIEGMPGSEVRGERLEASESGPLNPSLSTLAPTTTAMVARKRDVQEVINYREAIEYMDKLILRETKGLNEEIIGEMNRIITNKIVPEGSGGKYREVGAFSRNSLTWEKSLQWPDPKEVPWLMGQLVNWLKSEEAKNLHPVIRAGILHTWFVLIHPFEEGNGRTARGLSTLSLFLDGYNVKDLFSLEEFYDHDAAQYYAGIKSVLDSSGDYTLWLSYFSQGLKGEYNRVKERVIRLSKEFRMKKQVGQIAISERQEKIIEYLQNYARLINNDFERIFPDISEDTVLRELSDLIKKGVIVKRGKTKAARYELK